MALDKPKLTPMSILTLLEIGLEHAGKLHSFKENQKSSMFNFFKLLAVSKPFLNSSRKTSSGTWLLDLGYHQLSESIELSIKSQAICFYNKARLSVENACNLVKFLQPPYFNVELQYGVYETKVEKIKDVLQVTDGKISLAIGRYTDDVKPYVYSLIKVFGHRVYNFHCNAEFLDTEKMYSFPLLDCLTVLEIEDSCQLSHILRYETSELKLSTWHTFEIPPDSTKNLTIKKLALNSDHVKYEDAEKLSIDLLKRCPNTKHFGIKALIEHQTDSVNEIPALVAAYGQRLKDLKTCSSNYLSRMSVEIESYFYAEERDQAWIQKVCESPMFNGWDITFDSNEVEGFSDCDTLTIKLSDGKCDFTIFASACFQDEENDELFEDEEYRLMYEELIEDFGDEMNINEYGDNNMRFDDDDY